MSQTSFQLHCRHKHSNSCCKEEHLKGNRDCEIFFVHILTWTQIYQSPVSCSDSTLWRSLRSQFQAIWTVQICKISSLKHDGAWCTMSFSNVQCNFEIRPINLLSLFYKEQTEIKGNYTSMAYLFERQINRNDFIQRVISFIFMYFYVHSHHDVCGWFVSCLHVNEKQVYT